LEGTTVFLLASLILGCADQPISTGTDAGAAATGSAQITTTTGAADANYVILAYESMSEPALEYAAWRQQTGHAVLVAFLGEGGGSLAPVQQVRDLLTRQQAAAGDAPLYLLILGDTVGLGGIGVFPCENDLGDCYTDNAYGDLDGDDVPEVAVGRLPVSSAEEVSAYLDKAKRHELDHAPGPWDRRVAIYAGQPGFDDALDGAIETAVLEGIDTVDYNYEVLGVYDEPDSDYYYTPFEDKVIDFFNDGAVLTTYLGHGSSAWADGLPTDRVHELVGTTRMPFAAFFACLNGDFKGDEDSLAEIVLAQPEGPVGAFASVDISDVYGNTVLPYELQRAIFDGGHQTIGQAIVEAKRQAVDNDDDFRDLASTYAVVFGYDEEAQERVLRQHLDLYNLLGDPALTLNLPTEDVELVSDGDFDSGSLVITAETPSVVSGTATVTLEVERTVILEALEELEDDLDAETAQANWAKAMDKTIADATAEVVDGRVEVSLDYDASELPFADYFVKIIAWDESVSAVGVLQVE